MDINQIQQNANVYGVPIIRNESHKILEDIVRKFKPKHILEIGTAVGYSGIIMLKNSSADLLTIEHNNKLIKIAKRNFKQHKLSDRVKIINNDCLVEIAKLVSNDDFIEYFDFIFLDGPKAQYDLLLNGLIALLSPNGVFVADNVLFRGYVENDNKPPTKRYKTIIKRLNNFIENCKNNKNFIEFSLNTTEDGIIIAKKAQNE